MTALPPAPPHILLIDDRLEDQTPLIRMLLSAGMRVSQATSAQQGYHKAVALKPDLVVLDLHMPKMSGFSICRLLQEDPSLKNKPIIFLSSESSVEARIKGLTLGGVDFVVKPYNAAEVLARIQVHLRLSRVTDDDPSVSHAHSEEEALIQAATRILVENLSNPPALPELAAALGTHQKRLLKIFRAHQNTTVVGYIRKLRIEKAKALLAKHAISIEDIAAELGFSTPANFATSFKNSEGLTPREFRQKYRDRRQTSAVL